MRQCACEYPKIDFATYLLCLIPAGTQGVRNVSLTPQHPRTRSYAEVLIECIDLAMTWWLQGVLAARGVKILIYQCEQLARCTDGHLNTRKLTSHLNLSCLDSYKSQWLQVGSYNLRDRAMSRWLLGVRADPEIVFKMA